MKYQSQNKTFQFIDSQINPNSPVSYDRESDRPRKITENEGGVFNKTKAVIEKLKKKSN